MKLYALVDETDKVIFANVNPHRIKVRSSRVRKCVVSWVVNGERVETVEILASKLALICDGSLELFTEFRNVE